MLYYTQRNTTKPKKRKKERGRKMNQIKIKTGYNEKTNTHYYRTFDVSTNKIPNVGDVFEYYIAKEKED